MKKSLFTFSLLLLSTLALFGKQKPVSNNSSSSEDAPFKHQISLQTGRIGFDFFEGFFSSTYATLYDNSNYNTTEVDGSYQITGSYMLEYKNFIDDRISVGGVASFSSVSLDILYTDITSSSLPFVKTFTTKYYNFLGNFNVNYYSSEWVDVYGGIYAGLRLRQTNYNDVQGIGITKNRTGIGFQLDPFGIRVGKKLSGHFALGFGNLSLVKFGLGYRFN